MPGATKGPELDRSGVRWFNVSRPLSPSDLRGRVVVLNFTCFEDVLCLQLQDVLRRVEQAFPTEVAIIDIHVPRCPAEHQDRRVRSSLLRHGIRRPVVHDPHYLLRQAFGVQAWPTLVFLAPDGQVIGQAAGLPPAAALSEGITDMVRDFASRGELAPQPLPSEPLVDTHAGSLRFPARIAPGHLADTRLVWVVADSGHHQVVLFDDDGGELLRYGCGIAGWRDGPANLACFRQPQGVACDGDDMFVADTGNHVLRRIDRASGEVSTVAGTGEPGGVLRSSVSATGRPLSSPWDVVLSDGEVYFSNAGSHQLAAFDRRHGTLRPLAGNGGEDMVDGAADGAALAQPRGLALAPDGLSLYFVDGTTSAVRRLRLPAGRVETLVGRAFGGCGMTDGPFDIARLQLPAGLACADDGRSLVVADSGNDALRWLDLTEGTVRRLILEPPAGLAAPACVAPAGPDRLLVSDSGHHRIVEVSISRRSLRCWHV